MVRADLITAKLAELGARLRRIRDRRAISAEALASDQDAAELVSFNLLLAVQSSTDIASHLIADEGWLPASSLAESFARLGENGVLTEATAQAMRSAAGLRNVIAHGYAGVHLPMLHQAATEGLADLDRFSAEVAAWLSVRVGS